MADEDVEPILERLKGVDPARIKELVLEVEPDETAELDAIGFRDRFKKTVFRDTVID